MMNKCKWEKEVVYGGYSDDFNDDNDVVWKTSCGNTHTFEEGGVVDNLYRFCPYCGGDIDE
jgi:hypothetical protein